MMRKPFSIGSLPNGDEGFLDKAGDFLGMCILQFRTRFCRADSAKSHHRCHRGMTAECSIMRDCEEEHTE